LAHAFISHNSGESYVLAAKSTMAALSLTTPADESKAHASIYLPDDAAYFVAISKVVPLAKSRSISITHDAADVTPCVDKQDQTRTE
jgi:hypothetical protein